MIPKTEDQIRRIQVGVETSFLFKNLDESQRKEAVDAMFEKAVKSGEDIIKQGALGDYFYIVDTGTFDVFVAKGSNPPVKVVSYTAGASFGELALMYNAPRYAYCLVDLRRADDWPTALPPSQPRQTRSCGPSTGLLSAACSWIMPFASGT